MIGQALTYLNMIIGVAVTIWVALLLVQKRKSPLRYYIAFFYLLMAYVLFYHWSFRSGAIYFYPGLLYSDTAVSFAIGPIVYLYMARLLGIHAQFRMSSLLHFIPALLAACVLIAYHSINSSSMEYFVSKRPGFPFYESAFIRVLDGVSDFWVVLYLFLAAFRVRALMASDRFKKIKELPVIFYLLLAVAISYFAVLYAHQIDNQVLLACASVTNGVLIVACFLFSHRHPEITQTVLREMKAGRKADALLGGIDVGDITARLMELVERDKIFRDPNITLQSLSNMLAISTYQLSLILNEGMETNFRTFINNYRLKEARELLAEEHRKSILEIAFAVGFNSKSSFNTLFSRETGLSPREYRKNFLKK